MPKMIVSIDGVVIKEVQLTKDRTSLGRRPYNDIVIDNLAVSGEHAVLQMSGNEVFVEDLNSTNGTYLNGKAVKKQQLNNGDTVEIGKYKIKYVNEAASAGFEKTMIIKAGSAGLVAPAGAATAAAAPAPADGAGTSAAIKVMSGAAAGREVALVKVVTTIGKPGVAVAAITKRPHGFVVAHVEGDNKPTLNGAHIGVEPVPLKNGDVLELAGTQMQFVQR
ncbi:MULTISPECIES: FHA domain-containing protein [unclassified Polaromonas]|jgi:pSer/pThr/pTyr-binding forkhead associated (FHA) protein|uniref:FHA domain-containing protein n=1 Tax=unclassified Polaromonas TaxID=2638319 RepID=UPI000BC941A4|nr:MULTISPECIES: FHA domain-containing protein [unclassified Polaromonas]OYY38519.1 MAG: FHA domain-containing protein [Polaromonas sp. 35-63-35]OYZ21323.1 MAG: FHA domain-containing protein [Polaromonas sp. 16-63-31]OYZ79079.1 MAG: FHA domain-containing protein [Polaromonas sp. 24-63-21]OZA50257.1 MAG: FHA domain-containing protein [Polaromonas sp. 17-63-33]OZA89247.1 MAG: FHA domain-containing protein [Polaromonas sp. 39-63-25]